MKQKFWLLGLACLLLAAAPAAEPIVIEAKRILPLQREPEDSAAGRYDWGPAIMLDGDLYRMWWTRLGGPNNRWITYRGALPDGEPYEFGYPSRGDRIYYAESRDGLTWHATGDDFAGRTEQFGPDAPGPLLVLSPAESPQQRMHVGNPSVVKVEDTYYMYYEAPCQFVLTRDPAGKPKVGDEYHNQVFLAVSKDGRVWHHWPDDHSPQPVIAAPESNKKNERHRYGLGQPSACYLRGTYVLHYVESCTGPGDFIVRVEADNPFFRNPRTFQRSLVQVSRQPGIPAGSVARFAQTDVKFLQETWCLVRPAYGTGHFGILISRDGLFTNDAAARAPREVFPQVRVTDPRGTGYLERLYPRFLTDPPGCILVQDQRVAIYYSSGLGFKDKASTWRLHRCEIPREALTPAAR